MDVFSLRDTVVGEYKQFATSFTTIFAPDIKQQIEAIYAENRYWPEPLIQIKRRYGSASDALQLVDARAFDPGFAAIFRDKQTAATPEGTRSPSTSTSSRPYRAPALASRGASLSPS